MERVAGIEPACAAWKAAVLPLNYTRVICRILSQSYPRDHWLVFSVGYNGKYRQMPCGASGRLPIKEHLSASKEGDQFATFAITHPGIPNFGRFSAMNSLSMAKNRAFSRCSYEVGLKLDRRE